MCIFAIQILKGEKNGKEDKRRTRTSNFGMYRA